MKINYVIEDFSVFGGIERIVSQKASILATQYGHDVTVISVYKDDRPVRYPLDKSIRIIHLDVPWTEKTANKAVLTMRRITTLVKAVSRLNKAVKETKIAAPKGRLAFYFLIAFNGTDGSLNLKRFKPVLLSNSL